VQIKNVMANSITNVTIRGIGLNDYAANNNPAAVLRRLDLGPNGTFVDNYYSSFGVPYGDQPGLSSIVDVHLDPGRDLHQQEAGDEPTAT
jgi:hypothetical protein